MSLFERLERAGHAVLMLTVQYRMHPEIRSFPSEYFYHNKLTDGPGYQPLVLQRSVVDESITSLKPVSFLDLYSSHEERQGTSYVNEQEAKTVVQLLAFLTKIIPESDMAVISPYKSQVRRVKTLLKSHSTPMGVEVNRLRSYIFL